MYRMQLEFNLNINFENLESSWKCTRKSMPVCHTCVLKKYDKLNIKNIFYEQYCAVYIVY